MAVTISNYGRCNFTKTLFFIVVLQALLLLLVLSVWWSKMEEKPQVAQKSNEGTQSVNSSEGSIAKELVLQLEQELPEVDYDFWYYRVRTNYYSQNTTCAWYPSPLDLQYHNIYWQTFINGNVTFQLYAAYLDIRETEYVGVVRILATVNRLIEPFPLAFCQLWYDTHSIPLVVPVTEYRNAWLKGWAGDPRENFAHLLSCKLPRNHRRFESEIPRTVSLVQERCHNASNSLRVNYNHYKAPPNASLSIGVCLKAFDFPNKDISKRLIEWFELQRLLGASRVYAYIYAVHPAVERVLDYYQRNGFLELRPLTMASGMPPKVHYQHQLLKMALIVKRLNELIPYNDCFYRNMYHHDYMLNVDVDEVVMPIGTLHTWQQVLESLPLPKNLSLNCAGGYVALCAVNYLFLRDDNAEKDELFHLQHTMRYYIHQEWTIRKSKCFHNTRYSVLLHNHWTNDWLGGCTRELLGTNLAYLQHYRKPDFQYEQSDLLEDLSIWKYALDLREAVENVHLEMNLVNNL